MKRTIDRYLDRVLAVADTHDPVREAQIRAELRDHLEQKVDALKSQGMDDAEALVKAVEDHGNPMLIGYRLRPWRLIDVRLRGTARGFIAIGPKARGVIAIGGVAIGVVAMGGIALGPISFGGLAMGLLFAWGGLATGGVAFGGIAIGAIAVGGLSVGAIAAGGAAAGLWVSESGHAWSYFNWGNVPDWMRSIGQIFVPDAASPPYPNAFVHFMALTFILAPCVTVLQIGLHLALTARERGRIRRIDPHAIE